MTPDFTFYRRMAYLDRLLTRPVSRAIGRVILPWLGRRRLRHLRDGIERNLEVVLASRVAYSTEGASHGRREPRRLARRTFSNFGAYIADYFLLPFISKRTIHNWVTSSEGLEHLRRAVERDRGILLLTCHLGLWELGAIYLRHGGYPVHVVGLVDPVHAGITEFRDWLRTRQGIGVVNRDGVHLAALSIRQLLAEKKIVALLGDRLYEETGVEVDFLGRRAAFPIGPLRLARMTDATVLPCFVVRRGRGYRATIEPPVEVGKAADTEDDDLRATAQELARRFEQRIRRTPDQYYTFSPFWEPIRGFDL